MISDESSANWEWVKLGEVLVDGPRNGIYKPKEFHGSGTKIVNMGELFDNPRLRSVSMKRIRLSPKEEAGFALEAGDLLFARRSLVAEGAGKCSIVLSVDEPTVFESSIIRVRPDRARADGRYLFYFFSSSYGKYLLDTILRQVAVSGITGRDLVELEIPLPPMVVQTSISEVLSAIDDSIDLSQQSNGTLEAIAHAVFKSWFIDFAPVHAKAEGKKPFGMDDKTASLFSDSFEDSELGEIPKGWQVATFDKTLSTIESGRRPKGGVGELESGVPSIGAENVNGLGRYDYSKEKYVSEEFYDGMKSGQVLGCDVLLYKDGANIGRLSMARDDFPHKRCCINEHVFILRTNERHTQNYLYFWLDTPYMKNYVSNLNTSGAQPGLNATSLRTAPILLPLAQILEKYDEIVTPLLRMIFSGAKSAKTLEKLRDTLLPKLLSGEIRIPMDQSRDMGKVDAQ